MDELPIWHEIFTYDPVTGVLRWKIKPGRRSNVRRGDIAGSLGSEGYVVVEYKRRRYGVHRVIYEMVHGSIPQGKQIDHKNRRRSDNRITNLRLATKQENVRNGSVRCTNTSGFVGVTWHSRAAKWRAQLWSGTGHVHLGLFTSKSDAYAARLAGEKLYHGEFARSVVTEDASNG